MYLCLLDAHGNVCVMIAVPIPSYSIIIILYMYSSVCFIGIHKQFHSHLNKNEVKAINMTPPNLC